MTIASGGLLSSGRAFAEQWSVETSLAVTGKYDDNVVLDDQNRQHDLSMIVTPSIGLARVSDRATLSAHYRTGLEFFSDRSDLNNVSHKGLLRLFVQGLGRGRLSQTSLEILGAVTHSKQPLDFRLAEEPDGEGVETQRTGTIRSRTFVQLRIPVTPTVSGLAEYTNGFTFFQDPGLTDNVTHGLAVTMRKQLAERTTISSTYGARLFNFRAADNRIAHDFSVTINHHFSPFLTADLTAGATYLPDTRDVHPTGVATLTKDFAHTRVALSYTRRLRSGGGLFREPTVSQTVAVTLRRTFGERAGGSLTGGLTKVRSSGVSATETSPTATGDLSVLSGRVAFYYAVTSWLNATGAFRYSIQRADDDLSTASDIRRRLITLTLEGSWGRPIPTDERLETPVP